ncbi:hypothetical protein HanXRQr2_Chr09g0381781 [Helianthus annuus]|uniref:Agenet-like domain-containing protein n=1 Tax=Helianthus annuus TaxID=4232 RepID=A0A9K3I672_HELAN|nr:hypothetical protein HanXRQr2_Chr09g0381781 [Helianthus annuus]KAJ0533702.1 hypothetical protein HanIR_Chr09g0411431 [Helianthus annuus]KAJ0707003.1 hypothetical protein HanLR1_Chr09g0313591 [Helianthus annuus]KAJ0711028.1 hypothetical protein HanOQP8_Chr09g0319221 [Helianthus annuus]
MRPAMAAAFHLSEVVDAYDRDGWWIRKVIGITESKYTVHFKGTGEKFAYPLDLLRVHQEWDWKNGVWYFC